MLAVRIEKFGASSELQLRDIPKPKPGPDEVLVRVHAAAMNPSVVKNVTGKFHQTTLPGTPGRDFSGVVEETGQQIWATGGEIGFTQDGAHAEYVLVHQGRGTSQTRCAQYGAGCGDRNAFPYGLALPDRRGGKAK